MDQSSTRGQPMTCTARRGLFVNIRDTDLELGGQRDERRVPFHWGLTSLIPMRPSAVVRGDVPPVRISYPTRLNARHTPRTNSQDLEVHNAMQSSADALCSDPTHDRACLLARRTEMRQNKAWMRHRSGQLSRPSSPGPNLRARSIACFISTVVLVAIVSTYAGLLLSTSSQSTGVHIAFILLIILASVSFIYTFFRLCLTFSTPQRYISSLNLSTSDSRQTLSDRRPGHHHRHGRRKRRHKRLNLNHPDLPRGADALPFDDSLYTPTTPVRVFLSGDASFLHGKQVATTPELFFIDNGDGYDSLERANATSFEQVSAPPPAYGLWRCSVRADPNLLHWQPSPTGESIEDARRSVQAADVAPQGEQTATSHRPPSYVSTGEREQGTVRILDEAEQVSIGGGGVEEEEWPIRSANVAVQEATRMLVDGQC